MTKPAAVVTVSDGVASGHREDASGEAVSRLLADAGYEVAHREVVPDEAAQIAGLLRELADDGPQLVVTTGGTGLGPRDVTPEATRSVADREVPGLAEAMRAAGRASTPMADLSRGVVAATGATLVVNLPGSRSGATESLEAILEVLDHALDLLAGDTVHGPHDQDEPGHAGHAHDTGAGGGPAEPPVGSDRVDVRPPKASVHEVLVERLAERRPSVLATVVDVEGEPPSATGRSLLVGRRGPVAGTLGCSDFDTEAAADAGGVLEAGEPARCRYEHELGIVEVLLEPHHPAPRLVTVGATPVASWLLLLAGELGWETVLLETRPGRMTAEHRARAGRVVTEAELGLLDATSYLVHTDHDAPDAADQLAAALQAGAAYVGIMGSARHTGQHIQALRERGFDDQELERIESPAGIKLGPGAQEIAVGILAGLIRHRAGR